MRYSQFKAFDKHLQSSLPSNFSPLYCLIIKDPRERMLALLELKKHLGVFAISTFSADPQGEKALMAELDAFSLFSENKLLHLQGCEKLSKNTQGLLEQKILELPKQTTLVLSAESLGKQSAFYKAVEKHGVILEIGEEKLAEKEKGLAEWLIAHVHRIQKTITPDAADLLIKGSGASFAILHQEFEKLATYIGDKDQILIQDVYDICCLSPQDSTWAAGDAFLTGNIKQTLESLYRTVDQGGVIFSIIRQLRYQIRQALIIASSDRSMISQIFPHLKGYALEKQIQNALHFGEKRLVLALQTLDDLEFIAKDSLDDPKLLLTLLCTKVLT